MWEFSPVPCNNVMTNHISTYSAFVVLDDFTLCCFHYTCVGSFFSSSPFRVTMSTVGTEVMNDSDTIDTTLREPHPQKLAIKMEESKDI